ncbi:hypothetical protein BHE74_00033901, partial [Ensete ventricosum]
MPTIIKSKARFDIPVHTGVPRPKFAISTFTAQYGWYIPVRQVADTRTARYRAVPPKIDHRRSIEGEIERQRSIEREKGKKKKKREEKEEKNKRGEKEYLSPVRRRSSRAIAARTGRKIET